MWLLRDGRIYSNPDEFIKVLIDEGTVTQNITIELDSMHERCVETWDLLGDTFFTAFDVEFHVEEKATTKGIIMERHGEFGERYVIRHGEHNIRGCTPKEQWVVLND